MNYGKLLAWVSVGLSIGAAVGYGFAGDWRRVAYWISAAVLTTSVTI